MSLIFNERRGVGVAGTHGKTTTSSMLSLVAERSGIMPTVAIGGELSDIGCNAKLGKGEYMIAELDESDGSFELFAPDIAIVTNIDWDHVDHYPTIESVFDAFARFANGRKKNAPLIVCAEDAGVNKLLSGGKCDTDSLVTYGWGTDWTWGATDVCHVLGGGAFYTVNFNGKPLGQIRLQVSGEHNVMNSLAACAAAHLMGIPLQVVQDALYSFKGAKRRLQHVGKCSEIDVYDDYGHHPREVAATLTALRSIFPDRNLQIFFQPHRFSRTLALYEEFADSLSMGDSVYLLPIYAADEEPREGVTSALIADAIEAKGDVRAVVCSNFDHAVQLAGDEARGSDVILTIGAGDVGRLGKLILDELNRRVAQEHAVAVGS